jgi:hypothetical protein
MKLKSDLRKVRAKTAILAVTTITLDCSGIAFAQNEDKVKAELDLWKAAVAGLASASAKGKGM